jgi:hypothetical protein
LAFGALVVLDVADAPLVGLETFDLRSFIRDYLPRARELVPKIPYQQIRGFTISQVKFYFVLVAETWLRPDEPFLLSIDAGP